MFPRGWICGCHQKGDGKQTEQKLWYLHLKYDCKDGVTAQLPVPAHKSTWQTGCCLFVMYCTCWHTVQKQMIDLPFHFHQHSSVHTTGSVNIVLIADSVNMEITYLSIVCWSTTILHVTTSPLTCRLCKFIFDQNIVSDPADSCEPVCDVLGVVWLFLIILLSNLSNVNY